MFTDKNDKNIVRNAMIVLLLSLLIVYVIRYQVNNNHKDAKSQNTTNSIAEALTITEKETTLNNPIVAPTETVNTGEDTLTEQQVQAETQTTDTGTIDQTAIPAMTILSGTTVYFGPIEGIDKLNITYEYALKDNKDIYFVSLGDKEPDLSAIARSLGGTLYTINTETEILRNELFGKRVVFINIPEYKNKFVLMYIELGSQKWLLQISYSIYHQSKRYLQNLFTD